MEHSRGIVVGVNGGPEGDAALRFAVEEAAHSGESIEVITAWDLELSPVAPFAAFGALPTMDDLQQAARARQDAALARVLGEPPSVAVLARIPRGDARILLVEAARRARLLVVGSRPMGSIRAVLLGSVSRYCAQHAICPVVVVPAGLAVSAPAQRAEDVQLAPSRP
jgi:nucleotide-binding universal stress UspA family protein